MKYIIYILVILILFVGLFLSGFYCGNKIGKLTVPTVIESILIDTVTIRDTIIKPVPEIVRIVRTDTIFTPNDTIYLPIEQKTVIQHIDEDSVKGTIKVVYSGYDAVLDTLQWDLSVMHKTLVKRRKLGFTVGLSGGIGYDFNNKVTPFIGLGVTYGYNF